PEGATGEYDNLWEQNVSATVWEPAGGLNSAQHYQPIGQIGTVQYRRMVISGECPIDTSDIVTVETSPLSDAGNFTNAGQEVCPETIAEDINIENFTGEITWFESTAPNGPWSPTGGTEATFSPGTIAANEYFIAVVESGYCSADTSE